MQLRATVSVNPAVAVIHLQQPTPGTCNGCVVQCKQSSKLCCIEKDSTQHAAMQLQFIAACMQTNTGLHRTKLKLLMCWQKAVHMSSVIQSSITYHHLRHVSPLYTQQTQSSSNASLEGNWLHTQHSSLKRTPHKQALGNAISYITHTLLHEMCAAIPAVSRGVYNIHIYESVILLEDL